MSTRTRTARHWPARPSALPPPDEPPALPRPPHWTEAAACASADPDLWFPGPGDAAWEARAICARCPVLDPCREDALAHDDQHGIQGGLTLKERRKLKRQRDREALGEAA